MLDKYLEMPGLRLGRQFRVFSTALNQGRFSIRRDISLVFLCGANQAPFIPSERRRFLKKNVERHLPHTRIVYAEAVMEELAKHEKKSKNLLDLEHQISKIADWIVIVLESFSSFCELGAFAHKDFRDKLLVINDRHFQSEQSFINLGPIQAITDDISKEHVIWYPMDKDGVMTLDSIGAALPSVINVLKIKKKREKVDRDACLPSTASQTSLFFLHDLIYLCGPITHAETIQIYKRLFGDHSFDDIKALRGILHASNLIESKSVSGDISYISIAAETFINFGSYTSDLIAAFRRFHLKYNSLRLVNE